MRTKSITASDIPHHLPSTLWRQVDFLLHAPCWFWTGKVGNHGYGEVAAGRRDVRITTHRLSYLLAYGHIPTDLYVCHTCDNRRCVRPDHLYAGTATQNMQDMVRRGRHPSHVNPALRQGENHPRAKITRQQVEEIRARYALGGVTQQELGTVFGLTHGTISSIVRGRIWRS